MKDVELRKRFNQLLDEVIGELCTRRGSYTEADYLEKLRFSQDELEEDNLRTYIEEAQKIAKEKGKVEF